VECINFSLENKKLNNKRTCSFAGPFSYPHPTIKKEAQHSA